MTAARAALKRRRANRARPGPWLRSLGQTRKNQGLMPDRSGLEAEGEIIATGRLPAPYTRIATSEVVEVRWPITATTSGSSRRAVATRTATSSLALDRKSGV